MSRSVICRSREPPSYAPAFAAAKSCWQQLRQGVRYDAVVLCSELTDYVRRAICPAAVPVEGAADAARTEPWPQQRHGVAKAPRGVLLRRGHRAEKAAVAALPDARAGRTGSWSSGAASCMRRGASRRADVNAGYLILRGRHRVQHQPEAGDPQGDLAGGERAV